MVRREGVAGVQEFRSSGVQEFRSSGVQEFRSSGVQEFRMACSRKLQDRFSSKGIAESVASFCNS
jgi:hypothetical protein